MKKTLDKKLFFSMTMDFLNVYLPQGHDSEKTIKTYKDGLTIFRRYVTDECGISIKDFKFMDCTFDFVLDYRNWLLDIKKRKPSTVNNRLAAIKTYLRYAAAKDISIQQVQISITEVPFLRVPKVIRPIIENNATIAALLDAPPNTKTGTRDTMIMSLLFDTMIRAYELIQLDIKDVQINVETPHLLVHGKGNKERTVPLSENTIPLIRQYLIEYHSECNNEEKMSPFIYTTIHGKRHRMSERNVERILKKYGDAIRKDYPDLPASIYPHMLRRTRGTGLYRDGVQIEAIAVAMGHANIQTTKDHYAFPSLEQKREVMNKGNSLVITRTHEEKEWPDDEDELARLCGLR
ncbi:MAG: site-specific integrase [Lachnospiraceae bacterium]|nr:site-specific integrase [Lachnospiraceae bacterium]